MSRTSKGITGFLRRSFRRIFWPPILELSRTGKILQTLWDAAQLQSQQRESYRKIGEISLSLVRDGKLHDIRIERIVAKIDQAERILHRQDLMLRSYQQRGDTSDLLREDDEVNKDRLEPV